MNKIFISYSYEDQNIASRIADDLERLRIPYWFDRLEVEPGDNFIVRINEGLEDCNVVCLVLTENLYDNRRTAREEWTNFLARVIRDPNLQMIPMKFDDCQIPALLSARSYIDMRDYDNGLNELVNFFDRVNTYRFLSDFVRPRLVSFGGGSYGGKATISFSKTNPKECHIEFDIASQDSFAGISFESKEPINVSRKKYLRFDFRGRPLHNRVEIKLEYPAKTYYLSDYHHNYGRIAIPLTYYSDIVDLERLRILTIAMNDSHFLNKDRQRNTQEISIRNVTLK